MKSKSYNLSVIAEQKENTNLVDEKTRFINLAKENYEHSQPKNPNFISENIKYIESNILIIGQLSIFLQEDEYKLFLKQAIYNFDLFSELCKRYLINKIWDVFDYKIFEVIVDSGGDLLGFESQSTANQLIDCILQANFNDFIKFIDKLPPNVTKYYINKLLTANYYDLILYLFNYQINVKNNYFYKKYLIELMEKFPEFKNFFENQYKAIHKLKEDNFQINNEEENQIIRIGISNVIDMARNSNILNINFILNLLIIFRHTDIFYEIPKITDTIIEVCNTPDDLIKFLHKIGYSKEFHAPSLEITTIVNNTLNKFKSSSLNVESCKMIIDFILSFIEDVNRQFSLISDIYDNKLSNHLTFKEFIEHLEYMGYLNDYLEFSRLSINFSKILHDNFDFLKKYLKNNKYLSTFFDTAINFNASYWIKKLPEFIRTIKNESNPAINFELEVIESESPEIFTFLKSKNKEIEKALKEKFNFKTYRFKYNNSKQVKNYYSDQPLIPVLYQDKTYELLKSSDKIDEEIEGEILNPGGGIVTTVSSSAKKIKNPYAVVIDEALLEDGSVDPKIKKQALDLYEKLQKEKDYFYSNNSDMIINFINLNYVFFTNKTLLDIYNILKSNYNIGAKSNFLSKKINFYKTEFLNITYYADTTVDFYNYLANKETNFEQYIKKLEKIYNLLDINHNLSVDPYLCYQAFLNDKFALDMASNVEILQIISNYFKNKDILPEEIQNSGSMEQIIKNYLTSDQLIIDKINKFNEESMQKINRPFFDNEKFIYNLNAFRNILINFFKKEDIKLNDDIKTIIKQLHTGFEKMNQFETVKKYMMYAKPKDKKLYDFDLELSPNAKFEVLRFLDPEVFSIGAETNCCQRIGGAGEVAAIDSFINPLASVLKFTIDGNLISQSYFHYVPKENGLVLDNVESNRSNSLKYGIFESTLSKIYYDYAKTIKEKLNLNYVICGGGIEMNKIDGNLFKEIPAFQKDISDPRHFEVSIGKSNEDDQNEDDQEDFLKLKPYTDFRYGAVDLLQPKAEIETITYNFNKVAQYNNLNKFAFNTIYIEDMQRIPNSLIRMIYLKNLNKRSK